MSIHIFSIDADSNPWECCCSPEVYKIRGTDDLLYGASMLCEGCVKMTYLFICYYFTGTKFLHFKLLLLKEKMFLPYLPAP